MRSDTSAARERSGPGCSNNGRLFLVPQGKLSALQERILVVLSPLRPELDVDGGAALAGFHTKAPRDARSRPVLPPPAGPRGDRQRRDAGAEGSGVGRRARAFVGECSRSSTCASIWSRRSSTSSLNPTPIAEIAQPMTIGGATILVETPHQLLVNKLCALLSRSEIRDLIDIRVLVESGADLPRALNDCPGQDAGFSPMTFAWGAQSLPLRRIAVVQGWPEPEIEALEQFRQSLVEHVMAAARPGESN